MTFDILLCGLGSKLTCLGIGGVSSPLLGLVKCSRTKKQELWALKDWRLVYDALQLPQPPFEDQEQMLEQLHWQNLRNPVRYDHLGSCSLWSKETPSCQQPKFYCDWLTWVALQSHTKMNVHELLYYTILHYRSWSIESRHHEPVIHSLNPEAFAPGCNDGLVSPEPKPLWSRLRTCFSSHNNTRNLTSHHLLPLCQGNSAAIPAFAIRVLMPATSSRPKTVRRNRVTTSWSRGESRSVFMFSVVWTSTQLLCAHGNIVPLHHPLYRWRCLGWCPLSTPPRRWVGFGSDTIVSYKTGTVEMGRLDYPDAESSSLPGNICLNVLMKNWVLSKLGRFIHLQKLVASHLVRTAVALDYDMASRTQRPDENEPTASNKRQREEYCMGEGCLNMASRRLNANCTVSGLHPGCPQSSTMSWQTSPSSSTMYVYSPSLCTLLTLS